MEEAELLKLEMLGPSLLAPVENHEDMKSANDIHLLR